jgi:hypothetical protein
MKTEYFKTFWNFLSLCIVKFFENFEILWKFWNFTKFLENFEILKFLENF